MKKYILYLACIFTIAMWSCNTKQADSHDGHNHDHAEHDHDHDDHDHDHDDPNHSHDDHDHDDPNHSHDDAPPQEIDSHDDHTGHSHAEGEEIIMTPQQATLIGIETELLKFRPFHQTIKTSGQIVAAQGDERTIVATVNGVVSFRKTGANEGRPVKSGESLFSISSSNLAEGDPVAKAKNAYDIAKRDFGRAETLIADKLISQKEYNEIKLTYESAKISYNAIARGGSSSGANISSPINGFIKSRLVEEGQYVNVGEPLMVVTQNSKLRLRADISERYYKDLATIRSANFRTPYDNMIYKLSDMGGELISYGKSSSSSEYYIPVNFEFNNIGNIIPGSYVEVFLLSQERENVLTIPHSSLTDEQGIYYVYCRLNDEEYEKHEVAIGASDGERVEVLSGLHDNKEHNIVTKGAYHVKLASTSEAIPHGHEH